MYTKLTEGAGYKKYTYMYVNGVSCYKLLMRYRIVN